MLTLDQAHALADLIKADAQADDAETVARLNKTPGVAEVWVTERTLSANPQIGPAGAASLLVALEAAADSLAGSAEPADLVQRRLLVQVVARLTADGINLADPASLAMVDQLAQQMPGTPVAQLAPAIKAMVPTQAGRILGRAATADDLTAVRAVTAARTAYDQTITAAAETLNDALADALGE